MDNIDIVGTLVRINSDDVFEGDIGVILGVAGYDEFRVLVATKRGLSELNFITGELEFLR